MNYSDLISGFEQREIEDCLAQKSNYVIAKYAAYTEAKKIDVLRVKFSSMMSKLREHFGGF